MTTRRCWTWTGTSVQNIVVILMLLMVGAATMGTTNDNVTSDRFDDDRHQVRCPKGCKCTDGTTVACIDANLSSVPRHEPSSSSVLTVEYILTGNNLTRLESEAFTDVRSLRKLDVSDNDIETLEPNCFAGLTNLRELDLSENRLRSVDWSVVMDATGNRLAILNLTRNSIETLKVNSFRTLSMLRVLDLSGNRIEIVEPSAFRDLGYLLVLDLSDNVIAGVQSNTFDGLRSLRELRLQGNRIRDLTFGEPSSLSNVRVLDLSFNRIADPVVIGSSRLRRLDLRGNNITTSPATSDMPELQFLDLGSNPIVRFGKSQFSPGRDLRELVLNDLYELTTISDDAFGDLPNLHLVNLSSNARLKRVSPNAFRYCPNLAVLDLSHGGLETLHGGLISSLTGLKRLALADNKWRCDCGLSWMSSVTVELMSPERTKCVESNESVTEFEFGPDCAPAAVVHHSGRVSFRLGSTALLECGAVGDPLSAIKWVTPRHEVLHWYPSPSMMDVEFHSSFHDSAGIPVAQSLLSRVQVLRNGNLFIGPVVRSDAGSYLCLAANSLGAQSVTIAMRLDYDVIRHVKIVSLLVGVATSIAFLLTALVARLVEMMLDRFGWCCCRGTLPPRAKNIVKMLESIEHYKTQQLDRLRDNYTMQMQRIKDNCNQQMERIRESYSQQTDRFRDIREYGTQQLNCVREQYYEPIKRVRDYGIQQMNRVRENYVFQRNRVRKFQAHQLFKLRESYKVQQMHLNKILENMNLEICRTTCARTDSIVFTAETMDTASAFVGIVESGRRDSLLVAPLSADGRRGDMLLSPFSFEMFDFAAIVDPFPAIDDDDDPIGSVPTPAFLTPPQSPLDDHRQQQSFANTSQSSDDSFADFDEMVTCIVIPKSDMVYGSSSASGDGTKTVVVV